MREERDRRQATQLARDTVRVYRFNIDIVRALAQVHGFEALFYWQPVIYTKQRRTADEDKAYHERRELENLCLAVYDLVRGDKALGQTDGFRDISGLFDDSAEAYYIDFCHLSEGGNAKAAGRMVDDVVSALQQRAGVEALGIKPLKGSGTVSGHGSATNMFTDRLRAQAWARYADDYDRF